MKPFSELIERLGKTVGLKSSPPEAHDEPTAPHPERTRREPRGAARRNCTGGLM